MKYTTIKKAMLVTSLLYGFALSANSEIKVIKTVTVTANEATQSVFQVNMPSYSVVTVGILGHDRFKSGSKSSTEVEIELRGSTAYVKVGRSGHYSVGFGTVCGVSISIVMNVNASIDLKSEAGLLPKAVVKAPKKCEL